MQLVLRASLAVVVGAGAACGTAFSSSTGGSGDAGSDGALADVGAVEAASEGAAGDDGGSTQDTGLQDSRPGDGPTVSEGGGPGPDWCSTHPAQFCEDFDEFSNVTPFLSSWTTYSTIGGSFSFDQTNVPSGPNALAVVTTSTSGVRTLVLHSMSGGSSSIAKQRLEFDLLVESASSTGLFSEAAVGAIVFGNDVSAGAVALAIGNNNGGGPSLGASYIGPQPADGGSPAFGSANAPPPFPTIGQWDGRFAIEVQYSPASAADGGPSACAQIYVGSIAQLSPCLALPPALSHPVQTSIALGVYSGGLGNTGTVGVAFDNVTYNAQ